MSARGCLVAATIAASLTACGGSHRSAGAGTSRHGQPAAAVAPALALLLPASTAGPTTCTVYEPGFATQVVFNSQSLNVSAECQAWTSRQAGSGYLWAYQPVGTPADAAAITACDLRDPSGRVTAIVVNDTGFAPVSSSERATTAHACASLSLAGWVRIRGVRGLRVPRPIS